MYAILGRRVDGGIWLLGRIWLLGWIWLLSRHFFLRGRRIFVDRRFRRCVFCCHIIHRCGCGHLRSAGRYQQRHNNQYYQPSMFSSHTISFHYPFRTFSIIRGKLGCVRAARNLWLPTARTRPNP